MLGRQRQPMFSTFPFAKDGVSGTKTLGEGRYFLSAFFGPSNNTMLPPAYLKKL